MNSKYESASGDVVDPELSSSYSGVDAPSSDSTSIISSSASADSAAYANSLLSEI